MKILKDNKDLGYEKRKEKKDRKVILILFMINQIITNKIKNK